jgi:glycerol-3-phosphate dehydrogenase
MLPWLGKTVAGTTDSVTELTTLPQPHENEIQFILDEVSRYLCVKGDYYLFFLNCVCSSGSFV